MKLTEVLLEKKWSGDVKTKVEPPKSLFATGSAKKIAAWAIRSHDDAKGAMASLNFYLNRAGKGLNDDRKAAVQAAKKLVSAHFKSKSE